MYAEFLKDIGDRKAIPAHYEHSFECMYDNITRNENAINPNARWPAIVAMFIH